MKSKNSLGLIAWWLMVIGALNWGLIGVGKFAGGDWNVVGLLLGSWSEVEWIVYILVGVAAVYCLFGCKCRD